MMFTSYSVEQVSTIDGNIYLLQYGSYINEVVKDENVKNLDNYLSYMSDDKYYVFVGASTYYENALLLSQKLEEEGIYTYIKNDYISDSSLIKKISDLDKEVIQNNTLIKEKNEEILNLLKKHFN